MLEMQRDKDGNRRVKKEGLKGKLREGIMALTDDQLVTLKSELDNDPENVGYANMSDPEAADALNTIGLTGETIGNTTAQVKDVWDAIKINEFNAIPAGKQRMILTIIGNGELELDITNSDLVAKFLDTFTVALAPTTRTALIALGTRDASRGEVLFGPNIHITHLDVGRARQLP